MSKINKHNYEAYFLDYSEGNLSESEKKELEVFLEAHPDLKAELEDFEMVELSAEEEVDSVFKAKLKKEETTGLSSLDYLLIASAENELSDIEKKELAELMAADSTLLDEIDLYQKTKLPKEVIAFDDKAALKQKGGILIHWRPYAAAIASAAAVIWLFFNINITEPKYQSKKLNLQTAQSELKEEPTNFNYVLESEIGKEAAQTKKNVRSKKNHEPTKNQFAKLSNAREEEKEPTDEENQKIDKEELQPIESMPLEGFAENKVEQSPLKEIAKVEANQLADLTSKVEEKSAKPSAMQNDEVSIKEFAKQKLKKEVLKNKTFSEALAEELASITNDKISFETQKDQSGETEKFALNIGKFSISRK